MRFITSWFVFLWVISSILMIGMFSFLSRQLELHLIRKDNRSNMRDYKQHLQVSGDGTISEEEADPLEKGYYIVIQDSDGNIIYGERPEGLADYVFHVQEEDHVTVEEERYVVSNLLYRDKDDPDRKRYVIYGIADIQSVTTLFDDLKIVVFGFTLFSFVMLVFLYLFMKRRIDLPLRKMTETAVNISVSQADPEQLHYESGFYEIDTLEKAYLHLYEEMAEVIERQDHFNANVSHELRTPLTVIQAQCQVMRDKALTDNNEELTEAFDVIERQAEKMREVINILLRLSRLRSGVAKLDIEEFDLVNVIEAVCDEAVAEGADRKFIYDLEETIVRADVNLISIAIRNLISNAVKYSSTDSEIRVKCGTLNGRPYCCVADGGVGISESAMKRIYDSFYRGEESRSSEGFGLGLSLTKRIIEIHGGEITVESQPGIGSTFTLWFNSQPNNDQKTD